MVWDRVRQHCPTIKYFDFPNSVVTLGTFKSVIDDLVGTLCMSLTNSKRLHKFAGASFFRTENTIMIFFILIKLCKGPICMYNPRLRNEFI